MVRDTGILLVHKLSPRLSYSLWKKTFHFLRVLRGQRDRQGLPLCQLTASPAAGRWRCHAQTSFSHRARVLQLFAGDSHASFLHRRLHTSYIDSSCAPPSSLPLCSLLQAASPPLPSSRRNTRRTSANSSRESSLSVFSGPRPQRRRFRGPGASTIWAGAGHGPLDGRRQKCCRSADVPLGPARGSPCARSAFRVAQHGFSADPLARPRNVQESAADQSCDPLPP